MADLKQQLLERLREREHETGSIGEKADAFMDAYEHVVDGLKEFIEGTQLEYERHLQRTTLPGGFKFHVPDFKIRYRGRRFDLQPIAHPVGGGNEDFMFGLRVFGGPKSPFGTSLVLLKDDQWILAEAWVADNEGNPMPQGRILKVEDFQQALVSCM